ncbi:LuxR C-terminal-related transcriptional regulator [Zobellella sp. DQSA1]|uniref:LuxR C-terminal-related transcriptional regulator n=1 Tax=Zobellella sp. DQSA1 TaxID=3342386 RepID=UPI0035C0BB38
MEKENSNAIRVLLMTEFPIVEWGLLKALESGYPRMIASGCTGCLARALALLDDGPVDLVLLDLDGSHGVDTVRTLADVGKARVLVLTSSQDIDLYDAVVLSGARGVVRKNDPVEVMLKAVGRVSGGEMWVDRVAAGRILTKLTSKKTEQNPIMMKIDQLTRKERRAVAEIGRDASMPIREIAERLYISEHTLRNHLTSIYAKLGLSGRLELFVFANKHRLID